MHGPQKDKFITPTGEETCLAPLEKVSTVFCVEFQRLFIKIVDFFFFLIFLTSGR
jgi:hypothetical protein